MTERIECDSCGTTFPPDTDVVTLPAHNCTARHFARLARAQHAPAASLAEEAAYWDNLSDDEMDAHFDKGEPVELRQRPQHVTDTEEQP